MSETTFSYFGPQLLREWDPTPLSTRYREVRRRGGEVLRRASDHLATITEAIRSFDSAMTPDSTLLTTFLPWAIPNRVSAEPGLSDRKDSIRRQRAVAAVDSLRKLLDITEEQAASLLKVARGSIRSWRQGERDPYSATTRHLFEVDSIVRSLVGLLGEGQACIWLKELDDTGVRRMDRFSSAGGPQTILEDARKILFTAQAPRTIGAGEDLGDPAHDAPGYAPNAFDGPIRPRRVR